MLAGAKVKAVARTFNPVGGFAQGVIYRLTKYTESFDVNIANEYNIQVNSDSKRNSNSYPYQTKLQSGQSIKKVKPIWQSEKSFKELRDIKLKESKGNTMNVDVNNKNSSANISLDKNVIISKIC